MTRGLEAARVDKVKVDCFWCFMFWLLVAPGVVPRFSLVDERVIPFRGDVGLLPASRKAHFIVVEQVPGQSRIFSLNGRGHKSTLEVHRGLALKFAGMSSDFVPVFESRQSVLSTDVSFAGFSSLEVPQVLDYEKVKFVILKDHVRIMTPEFNRREDVFHYSTLSEAVLNGQVAAIAMNPNTGAGVIVGRLAKPTDGSPPTKESIHPVQFLDGKVVVGQPVVIKPLNDETFGIKAVSPISKSWGFFLASQRANRKFSLCLGVLNFTSGEARILKRFEDCDAVGTELRAINPLRQVALVVRRGQLLVMGYEVN